MCETTTNLRGSYFWKTQQNWLVSPSQGYGSVIKRTVSFFICNKLPV